MLPLDLSFTSSRSAYTTHYGASEGYESPYLRMAPEHRCGPVIDISFHIDSPEGPGTLVDLVHRSSGGLFSSGHCPAIRGPKQAILVEDEEVVAQSI